MTAAQVLSRVQRLLADPDEVRWSESVLLSYLGDAMNHLAVIRPDVFLSSADLWVDPARPTDTSTQLPVDDEYLAPVAELTAAKALQEDSSDTANETQAQSFIRSAMFGLGMV